MSMFLQQFRQENFFPVDVILKRIEGIIKIGDNNLLQ